MMIVNSLLFVANALWLIAVGWIVVDLGDEKVQYDYHLQYHSIKWHQKYIHKLIEGLQLEILFGTKAAYAIQEGIGYLYAALLALVLALLASWHAPLFTSGIALAAWLILPVIIIEFLIQKVSDGVDQSLLGLLQSIHAGLLQTGDIISALKYAETLVKDRYLIRLLNRFNYSIQKGLSPEIAFEQLRQGAHHDYFAYVILNIEQVYQRRGDVISIIQALQVEHTAIQIELNKRQIELKREKMMVTICMCVFLGVIIEVIREESYIWLFYHQHTLAGYVFAVTVFAVILTLFVLIKGDQLKY
ncbi:hypothetical protein KHM83_07660 [Fusibacter paucivorans]|uniref:Flp pilus assembly protein TadB n=1 Tax=Fusibacter paucivorans TaxID=76009 RepID=A0ABS5PNA3_9FIRM|nr:hypothetical protein [Fusibacter paucivorans]MBS7526548.1 hypothetical protein [Fusibacter paucivorans]